MLTIRLIWFSVVRVSMPKILRDSNQVFFFENFASIVSAIQAAFSFLVGFIVCKSTCSKSFVYASHFLMEAYGWFGTAYFMYDIWSMYKVHTQTIADKLKLMRLTANGNFTPKSTNGHANGGLYDKHIAFTYGKQKLLTNGRGGNAAGGGEGVEEEESQSLNGGAEMHTRHHEDEIYDYDGDCIQLPKAGKWDFLKYIISQPVMMIHHIFIGTFGLLVVTYIRGGGHCIYSYMFMMEFSTPFVSMRSILSTLGLKESRLYIANGLAMLGTFFICRVFMWPYVMWRYSVVVDATFWQAMTGLPRGCLISIAILFLPQLYWFFLMVKGALKVFSPTKARTKLTLQQKQQLQSKNNNLSPLTDNSEDFFQNGQPPASSATNSNNGTADLTTAATTNTKIFTKTLPVLEINGKN